MAPDPLISDSDSPRAKGVRFVAENSPTSSSATTRNSESSATKITKTEQYIDLYGRFSPAFEDSQDDREFYSKRGSSQEGDPQPPLQRFFYGILAAASAVLAFLPLCSWPAWETFERFKGRYYIYGFFVGLCIFISWAGFLVYIFGNVGESTTG